MSFSNIRSALAQAFVNGAFFDADKIAWENVPFVPPNDVAWCAFHFVPSQPDVATLGDAGRDEVTGFVQLDLNYPSGLGDKDAADKFDALRNVFTAGAKFSYNGVEAVIRSCGRSNGRIVNNCYRVPVTIAFYSQINR